MMDALSFAAVISATDDVAALTFIHEDTESKLFAILFGEGVVNDALCVVIYKILTDFQSAGGEFNFSSVISMWNFLFIIWLIIFYRFRSGSSWESCLKIFKKI